MGQIKLQTEVLDWVIVFNDRSAKFINKERADKIIILSTTPDTTVAGVKIDNEYYKFATFAKVISALEYYKQYPQKKPMQGAPTFRPINIITNTNEKRVRNMLRSSIKGLQLYIDSKGGIENVSETIQKRFKKLEKELKEMLYGKSN